MYSVPHSVFKRVSCYNSWILCQKQRLSMPCSDNCRSQDLKVCAKDRRVAEVDVYTSVQRNVRACI